MSKCIFVMGISVIFFIGYKDCIEIKGNIIVKGIKEFTIKEFLLAIAWIIVGLIWIKGHGRYNIDKNSINLDSNNIQVGICYIALGLVWLRRAFKGSYICEKGIYTKYIKYKWDEVISYRWIDIKESKNINGELIEYYSLILFIKQNQSWKLVNNMGEKRVYIDIKAEDRHITESFLDKRLKCIN